MPSIKYKKKTYAGATFPVLEMTKAEYDALPEAKKMDGTVYMITDDTGGWEAERSVYDNTESGLSATNVQAALDEICSIKPPKEFKTLATLTYTGQADHDITFTDSIYNYNEIVVLVDIAGYRTSMTVTRAMFSSARMVLTVWYSTSYIFAMEVQTATATTGHTHETAMTGFNASQTRTVMICAR